MPLLCISITTHDQEVQLPSEIGAQEAILRMVSYDQARKKGITAHPSWELNISDMLGNSKEIAHSPGHTQPGNTRLPLPNLEYTTLAAAQHHAAIAEVPVHVYAAGTLYPNIKFHLGHLRTAGTRIQVYQTNPQTGESTPFFSRADKKTEIEAHEADQADVNKLAAMPNFHFREIKLYFEYQTNDHTASHG